MLIGDSSKSEKNISSCISSILWYSCWETISYIWDQKLVERLKGKNKVSYILYKYSVKDVKDNLSTVLFVCKKNHDVQLKL